MIVVSSYIVTDGVNGGQGGNRMGGERRKRAGGQVPTWMGGEEHEGSREEGRGEGSCPWTPSPALERNGAGKTRVEADES